MFAGSAFSSANVASASQQRYDDSSYGNRLGSRSFDAYGLDSESEEDVDSNAFRNYGSRQLKTNRSFFAMMLKLGECVLPVQSIWQKMWAFIHWMVSSLSLYDTWILSRQGFRRSWILLLLLLLPLILLNSRHANKEAIAFISTISSKVKSFDVFPLFRVDSKDPVIGNIDKITEETFAEHTFIDHSHINTMNIEEMMIKLNGLQQGQLSRPDIEQIVRSVVKEEIYSLSSHMSMQKDLVANQAERIVDHSEQLASLDAQMKIILSHSETLTEELRSTKEKILGERQSSHIDHLAKLNNLEVELESLKDGIRHVHDTQTLLLSGMRNCCRNHTFDPVLVENQVATVLLQIMGQNQKAASRSEFQSFAAWLKSSFVGHSELDDKVSRSTKMRADEMNADMMSHIELTAKNAAATAVRASLMMQQKNAVPNGSVTDVRLNEEEVRRIVRDALILYDADKTGRVDFALESGGGSIISTRCSETYHSRTALLSLFGIPLWYHSNSPRTVIQPGVHPGECWAFKGSEGYLVIQLSGWIQPTAFSVEHIPRSLAPDHNIDSAPKEFSVYGLKSDKDLEGVFLGQYEYDIHGESLQYFLVADPEVEAFPIMELRIHSNHGNLDYTCLYRFRVHGQLIKQ